MLEPTLSTLAWDPSWELFWDLVPIADAELLHKIGKYLIFLFGPVTSNAITDVVHLKPTSVALDFWFPRYESADTAPWIGTEVVY